MMNAMNDGAQLPVQPDKRYWRVIAPVGKTPLHALLLSPRFTGYWTHWVKDQNTPKGKVFPCPGEPEKCWGCKQGLGLRWTGYIACKPLHLPDPHVLALTERAARALLTPLAKRGTLRGLVVVLSREAGHANAPVTLAVKGAWSEDKTPPDFEIEDTLNRMWGISPGAARRGKQVRTETHRIDRDPDDREAFRREFPQGDAREYGW